MKTLYCITCPNGCQLSVQEHVGELKVEGNGCDKGAEFAITEMTDPKRSLTTTVRTSLPGIPVLPVRTDGEIPKEKIREAMKALSDVVVSIELDCGDTVLEDIAGSGVRVIAASDVLQRRELQFAIRNMQRGTGSAGGAAGASFYTPIGSRLSGKPGDETGDGDTEIIGEDNNGDNEELADESGAATGEDEAAQASKEENLRSKGGRAQIRRR